MKHSSSATSSGEARSATLSPTAPGLTAPTAVSTAASANMIHGIAPIRPRTARTANSTSQSTVPLFCATANRNVIPTSVRNRSLGNPAMMSSVDWSATTVPTRKAPTNASTPMLTGSTVAITKISPSTRIEMSSGDILSRHPARTAQSSKDITTRGGRRRHHQAPAVQPRQSDA
jgi:hypothetical protein